MGKFWREEIESYKLKPLTAMVAAGIGLPAAALMTGAKRFLASYCVSVVLQGTGDIINGKWIYKKYRKKEQIAKGYGGKQYACRYQGGSFSVNFRFLKIHHTKMDKGKTGSWWFSSKLL